MVLKTSLRGDCAKPHSYPTAIELSGSSGFFLLVRWVIFFFLLIRWVKFFVCFKKTSIPRTPLDIKWCAPKWRTHIEASGANDLRQCYSSWTLPFWSAGLESSGITATLRRIRSIWTSRSSRWNGIQVLSFFFSWLGIPPSTGAASASVCTGKQNILQQLSDSVKELKGQKN